jgi:hypothetical protein
MDRESVSLTARRLLSYVKLTRFLPLLLTSIHALLHTAHCSIRTYVGVQETSVTTDCRPQFSFIQSKASHFRCPTAIDPTLYSLLLYMVSASTPHARNVCGIFGHVDGVWHFGRFDAHAQGYGRETTSRLLCPVWFRPGNIAMHGETLIHLSGTV